jgi:hypothetical protein
MDVRELAMRTIDAMRTLGLSPHSVWGHYYKSLDHIVKLHEAQEKSEFDREIVTEHVRRVDGRYERGEIGLGHYRNLKLSAQRLTEMHDPGKLDWTAPKKKSGFQLNEYFESVIAGFIVTGGFSPKGASDAMWVSRKYFAWLILEGHAELAHVGADEIQGFIIHCSHHMKSSGIHNIKLYMKKLFAHLADNGYVTCDHSGLFSFPVSRESRLFPALPSSEIATILELIDRRTPKGKRDYAIVCWG